MKRLFSLKAATLVLALGMFVVGAKRPIIFPDWPCWNCHGFLNCLKCGVNTIF